MKNEMVRVSREVLERMAQRAKVFDDGSDGADAESAISVAGMIRAILAQPVAEHQPVAFVNFHEMEACLHKPSSDEWIPVYTAPIAQAAPSQSVQLAEVRRSRVYLAGPMTGIVDYNFPAFNAEAERLRAQGSHVENPADHGVVEGAAWADYLHYDIGRLATCECIHLLPGWTRSRGAKLEVSIAQALGMQIRYAAGAEKAAQSQPEQSGLVEALESAVLLMDLMQDDIDSLIGYAGGTGGFGEYRDRINGISDALSAQIGEC